MGLGASFGFCKCHFVFGVFKCFFGRFFVFLLIFCFFFGGFSFGFRFLSLMVFLFRRLAFLLVAWTTETVAGPSPWICARRERSWASAVKSGFPKTFSSVK